MLKDIRKIKIQGANFDLSDELEILEDNTNNQTNKGTLIYGRNGSGKSTISRAFEKVSEKREISNVTAIVCDGSNNEITLTEEEKKKIFVFNEDFVSKYVKVEGKDNLQTIIMFGEVVELSEKIEKIKNDLEIINKQIEEQNKICDEYSDKTKEKSPFFYLEKMKEVLRGDENWAGRYREIKSDRHNAQVNDETYKQFIGLHPEKTRDKLIVDFDIKREELKKANEGALEIKDSVPVLDSDYIKYDDVALQNILKEVIDKPDFTEREKRLFNMLEKGHGDRIKEQLTVFQDEKTIECPFCFRSIDNQEKESLVDSLKKVLSKKVEEHVNTLHQKYNLSEIEIDLGAYKQLEGYSVCLDFFNKTNDILKKVSGLVNKKIDNPYEPVDEQFSIAEIANKLNDALKELEKERIKYNEKVCDINPIKEELNKINNQIAHYDIKDLHDKYQTCKQEQQKVANIQKEIQKQFDEMKEELNELESKKNNYRLARDFINDCLKYIFFADDRLSIKYQDDAYYILSYGKDVKPCDVSVGERNIIGLCYFFASIFDRQEEQEAYGKEYLLIVDDPISSYDWENRIGILSFLKFILDKFLVNNVDTKVIVMTHDILTFYDFTKIFKEIQDAFKSKHNGGCRFEKLELKEKRLQKFNIENRQEYSVLLQKVYDYAFGDVQQDDFAIGNIMRQVLEAFSTFMYRKGIEEVSNDERILGLLGEKQYTDYFKNLMYRLVLNGGSHKKDQVTSMKDFNFFELISVEQKKRTGKDILCFIYLLNKEHLLRHLEKNNNQQTTNFENKLDKHCKEIKKSCITS